MSMRRVLVVDDEVLVRMGFRSIMDWESCGYTVVGDAADGVEAMEKIRVLRPELVFTDLKMERMDGFELMNTCAREFPETRFIVLSSYNDFDNVREAMRCGALDYVFKLDVKPEQLRKMLNEMKWERPAAQPIGRNEQRAVCAATIHRAIAGEAPEHERREAFAALYPQVRWDEAFRLVTVVIDNYELRGGSVGERLSESAIMGVEGILSEVLGGRAALCPFRQDHMLLLWQGQSADAMRELQNAYAQAEEYVRRYMDCSITAVMSEEHPTLCALPAAHAQNEETLAYRYLLDHGRIHGYHLPKPEAELPPPIDLTALENALRLGQREQVMELCAAAFSQMRKRRGLPLPKLRVYLLDMLFTMKRAYPAVSTWTDGGGFSLEKMIQRFDRLETVRSAFQEALAVCVEPEVKSQIRPEIAQILRYVSEHPAEEMSVSKAAQMTRLSESYFAHIFKREMGLSFIDWLNRERIQTAERMLRQTTRRVNEIAADVGIDNANYFSVLFKKRTGRTPMEAREEGKSRIVIEETESE